MERFRLYSGYLPALNTNVGQLAAALAEAALVAFALLSRVGHFRKQPRRGAGKRFVRDIWWRKEQTNKH